MKKLILIITAILTLCLTSCVSDSANGLDEFIERYNSVSESSISRENFNTYIKDSEIIHTIMPDSDTIITLTENEKCEIKSCNITTRSDKLNRNYIDLCIKTLMSIIDIDEETSQRTINSALNSNNINFYGTEISVLKDNIQTTIIIHLRKENSETKLTLKSPGNHNNYN